MRHLRINWEHCSAKRTQTSGGCKTNPDFKLVAAPNSLVILSLSAVSYFRGPSATPGAYTALAFVLPRSRNHRARGSAHLFRSLGVWAAPGSTRPKHPRHLSPRPRKFTLPGNLPHDLIPGGPRLRTHLLPGGAWWKRRFAARP